MMEKLRVKETAFRNFVQGFECDKGRKVIRDIRSIFHPTINRQICLKCRKRETPPNGENVSNVQIRIHNACKLKFVGNNRVISIVHRTGRRYLRYLRSRPKAAKWRTQQMMQLYNEWNWMLSPNEYLIGIAHSGYNDGAKCSNLAWSKIIGLMALKPPL